MIFPMHSWETYSNQSALTMQTIMQKVMKSAVSYKTYFNVAHIQYLTQLGCPKFETFKIEDLKKD